MVAFAFGLVLALSCFIKAASFLLLSSLDLFLTSHLSHILQVYALFHSVDVFPWLLYSFLILFAQVTQKDVPGIDATYLAMDTEEGVEVVWNEMQFSERKKFRLQKVCVHCSLCMSLLTGLLLRARGCFPCSSRFMPAMNVEYLALVLCCRFLEASSQ